jgi:predicted protein tyrosine phosphatase
MAQGIAISRATLLLLLHRLSSIEILKPFSLLCVIEPEDSFPPIPDHGMIENVLCVKFDDVCPEDNCLTPATDAQLDLIAAYLKALDGATLVVSCKAGISRSVAVLAAYEVYHKLLTVSQAVDRYTTLPYYMNTWIFTELLGRLTYDAS